MSQTLNINYDPYAPGTFALTFTVNGVAPDLSTGYGATMRIWRSGIPTTSAPDVTVTHPTAIALGTSGSIILDLVVIHAALALVSSTEAVWTYDLIVTPTGSYSQKVCSGQLAEGVGSDQTGDVSAPISVNWAGTVGGDLSGTLPNPTVDGIQGRAVASTAPTNGQVLAWNSAQSRWEPQPQTGGLGGVTSVTPAADNGSGTAITTSGTISVLGTANEVTTSVTGTTITVGLPDEVTVVDLNTDRVDFNTTPASTTEAVGRELWDATWETLSLGMDTSVSLKYGQQLYIRGHNTTGTQINRGKVVYIAGGHATTEASIALADADAESTSAFTVGIAAENIAQGATGFVQVFGYMAGLVTNGYSGGEGTALYLSSTAGDMTSTLPTQPKHGFRVGILVKKSGSGSIFVSPQNYQELDELSDVLISGPAEQDLLSWDNTALVWKNRTIANAGVAAASHAHGNITSGGAIGLTDGLVVKTGTSGAVETLALPAGKSVLTSTASAGSLAWELASGLSGLVTVTEHTFTASGTFTQNAACKYVLVEMSGGGGGGGNGTAGGAAGIGGCGGMYWSGAIASGDLGTTTTVTIGAGGAAGVDGSATSLTNGTTSVVLCEVNGGRNASSSGYAVTGVAVANVFGSGGAAAGGGGRHGGYGPGGGGGGHNNSTSGTAGGRACSMLITSNAAAVGGGAAGGTGSGNGADASVLVRGFGEGAGGGGGRVGTSGSVGNGGAGTRGSGGGGGGASTSAGGTGGTGGAGFVRIIEVRVA